MSLTPIFASKPKASADTAVIFVYEKAALSTSAKALDKKAGGLISQALDGNRNFTGASGQIAVISLPKAAGYRRAILAGMGDIKTLDLQAIETNGGKLFPVLKGSGAVNVSIYFDLPKGPGIKLSDAAATYALGLKLRSYAFEKYKTKKKTKDDAPTLATPTIILDEAAAATKAFKANDAVAEGVFLARDVTNEPANILYPESYAAIIKKQLAPLGVTVEVIDDKKMAKLGFHSHLAVGMGSDRLPRVVVMRWNGLGTAAKGKKSAGPLAFVGKGVTFDTGGVSIKPAAGMEDMVMDMGGSAAVVGLIKSLALRKAKVDVVGIVGLAENMLSGHSYRPGDIIDSMAGKTIQVLNTDAEGRLVLCDALTYVQKNYKPQLIVDLATLTGAVMVALGFEYAGVFANDDKLWGQLEKSARLTGEKLWRMPLDEAYKKEMEGSVSDLKNLGNQGRYGGACSAAGFLEHFIENKTPWVHIDIAGTAWLKYDRPTGPRGATGFGVRVLDRLVADYYEA
jgi:leucyl aminopeptidase